MLALIIWPWLFGSVVFFPSHLWDEQEEGGKEGERSKGGGKSLSSSIIGWTLLKQWWRIGRNDRNSRTQKKEYQSKLSSKIFQEGGVKQFKIQIRVIRYTAYILKCVLKCILKCSCPSPIEKGSGWDWCQITNATGHCSVLEHDGKGNGNTNQSKLEKQVWKTLTLPLEKDGACGGRGSWGLT